MKESEKKDIPDHINVTDTLDLHGFFPEQIPEIVNAFIENAMELKLQNLRIIHGKGKSRLKFEVHQVLKQNPHVLEFNDSHPISGGWGATEVVIKIK